MTGGVAVMTIIVAGAAFCVSTILIASLIRRARHGHDLPHSASVARKAGRFVGGPFPLSIALHAFLLLLLIVTMHERRNREMISLVIDEPGGGGGDADELRDLDFDTQPMPEIEPAKFSTTPSISGIDVATLQNYVRGGSPGGIGMGNGGGLGNGNGLGMGNGPMGYLRELRRTGLDIVLVIDGTGSMSLVIRDVKAKMRELVAAVHRMVPNARIGMVVYGGKSDAVQAQPLTLSPAKLESFLGSINAAGGDEWEENVRGGIATAIDQMDWHRYAKKVIVLVADTPPAKDDFAATRQMIAEFRTRDGTFNAVDLTRLEHERFEEAFDRQIHGDQGKTHPDAALPQFHRETQLAYQVLTRDGGGAMHSLDSNEQINQQVMLLAFGDQWREMIASFSHPLASK
jgi:hypothetical protein